MGGAQHFGLVYQNVYGLNLLVNTTIENFLQGLDVKLLATAISLS